MNSVEMLCSIEATEALGFEKYLLSQVKKGSQSYQLWLLVKQIIRARLKADVPAPGNPDLARTLGVSASQVRNRLSDLVSFYQEYLAVLRMRSTPRLSALFAMEQAVETNNESYVEWAEKKTERLVTKSVLYDTYARYDYLRYNRVIYDWYEDKYNRIYTEKTALNDQELDGFILIEKYKLYMDATSLTYESGAVLYKLDREILQLRENRTGGEPFSFAEKIYHNLYLIVKRQEPSSYRFIFSRVEEIFRDFSSRDIKYVLSVLFNRIAGEIMSGNDDAQKDYYTLIVTLMKYPKVRVTEWILKNCVTVLCRMKKEDFAETVLNTYLSKLPENRQKEVMSYNLAIIRMTAEKFDEATKLLNQITISESTYYLGGRFILFRSMYKAEEYEGLLSLTKSFKGYVTRLKDMSDGFRKAAFFFLRFFNELVRLSLDKPFMDPSVFERRMKQLQQKVLGTKSMASKEWLLEEIDAHL
ncbi:hypothetical protein FUA23_15660 [Neolewinella aurantiaca]|uniref:Uncharacterized protein n=1 Tax=Neolewinella aurantiaca TaxID=2602767 RepID=A0A5C7FF79_9BACT|nr:AsnC family protein [Neolewinella aurantiaca]TXF88245.1 hypothetical protein FUA23_15660 [Neolewinella aurantiaca]